MRAVRDMDYEFQELGKVGDKGGAQSENLYMVYFISKKKVELLQRTEHIRVSYGVASGVS